MAPPSGGNNLFINLGVLNFQGASGQLNQFQNQIIQNNININQSFNQVNNNINSLGGGLKSLFAAGGIYAGVTKFADLAKTAIDKTNEAIRANRLLASTATEAGLAYEVLAQKNQKTAQTFGLSNVEATKVTAKIQQLATFTGNASQFDLLQKRLADLSAAKGIESRDLSVLVGSILSGQDEGLNRLGIADPGKLYEAYAKQIGKSTDALTQFEKVQATVNAVISKGAIFDGTAEDRMNSLEGATARTTAMYDNFTSNLSQAATGNMYFQNTLDLINRAFESMSFNIDTVRKKLKEGLTPEQIAAEEQGGAFNLLGGALNFVGAGVLGVLPFAYDIGDRGVGEAWDIYYNSMFPQDLQAKQRAEQIRNQQRLDKRQNKDASTQAGDQELQRTVDGFQSRIDAFIKPAKDGVDKARQSIEELNKLKAEFTEALNTFGEKAVSEVFRDNNTIDLKKLEAVGEKVEKLKALRKQIDEKAARAFYTRNAQENLDAFFEYPTVSGARQNTKVLAGIEKYLSAEDFKKFGDRLSNFIESETAKIGDFIKKLETQYDTTFNNLYQKTNANNPFASVFSEADRSLKSLRENIKGLAPELRAAALEMQDSLNANALFSARLENSLNAFDLRDSATNFRDFREKPFEIKDSKQFFKDFNEFYAKQIESQTGGSFLGYAKNAGFGGTTSFDLRDGLNFAFDRLAGGGSLRRERTFADLSELEKQNYLSSANQVDENRNLSLQNRLDKQFAIINSLGAANPEQLAIANRKIISLTQGVDPSQLTGSQREQAALAREREAVRLEAAEREARDQRQKQIELQERIAVNQEKLLKIAEERGLPELRDLIEIQVTDKTNGGAGGGVNVLGASPKPEDMLGGTFYEQSRN